jgi:FAD-dependent urate hydroxylase
MHPSAIDVDYVVAGTGFRIDLTRLPFLTDGLRTRIATVNGYPVVSRAGESTVPGLYFVGAPTAVSLGPSARFIAGTHNTAGKVARSVARRSNSGRGNAAAAGPDRIPHPSGDAPVQETV